MFEIKNAKVHPGCITFIHADAIDQTNELFQHLPAAKEKYTVSGEFIKEYTLESDTEGYAILVLYLW